MIALILGGARTWEAEAAAAEALIGERQRMVVACNLAGVHWPGRLDGWATHHPEFLAEWVRQRHGKGAEGARRLFALKAVRGLPDVEVADDLWRGSSGLYAVQCALLSMGATGAILCGVPMDSRAGHFTRPEGAPWERTGGYRTGFSRALPAIGARVRSMSGWTAELFGSPTDAWVEAVHNIRPLGATPDHPLRSEPMPTQLHHIKNTGEKVAKIWVRAPSGLMQLKRLRPGESGRFEIDPDQQKFQPGAGLEVRLIETGKAKRKADTAPVDPATPPEGADG